MAVTVGELAVELDARTSEFRSAMKGAERRIDSFEGKAKKGTEKAGSAFKGLVGPIAAVAGALAAVGAIRFGSQIAQGAIESAAAFETYEIRLRALLGSQQSANLALDSFVELSSKTPFGVEQIVEGAAVLASVADGSRKELDELVKVTTNLAAVTGIPFAEAAANLQRSLAAGISAADKFREAGVRKLIEDINKIPDLTKFSLEEQRQLFKDTFGPDALTPYATAADDLAKTMGGALSNIGDAAANAKRELGEALSPATFATAKAVVIPFFELLEKAIVDDQDAITGFVTDGIRKLLFGFQKTLESGADILDFFDEFQLQLGDMPEIFGTVIKAFGLFFDSIGTGLRVILVLLTKQGVGWGELGNLVGLVTDEQLAALRLADQFNIEDMQASASALNESVGKALAGISVDLENIVTGGKSMSQELRAAGTAAGLAADQVGKLVDNFVRAREERKQAQDETGGGGRRPTGAPGIGAGGFGTETASELASVLGGFGGGIDLDIAEEARIQKERKDSREDAEDDAADASRRLAEDMAWNLTSALGDGFAMLLDGEGGSFAEGLAQLSGDLLNESIGAALQSLEEGLADALEGLSGEGGLLSGLLGEGGAGLGQAIGAVAGIAGGLIAGAIQGTESTVQGGSFASAVTSTEQVRGIVAGDVNVPIAEVAGALRDMNVQTVAEARQTNRILTEIRDRLGGLGGDTTSAADALASAVTQEFQGSVALG